MKHVVRETAVFCISNEFLHLVLHLHLYWIDFCWHYIFLAIAARVGGLSWRCLINPLSAAEIGQIM